MNGQKENIGLLIGKVTIVCLFLFLFALKSIDCSVKHSFSKISAVEQIGVVNKLPILNKPVFSPSFNIFGQLYKVNNTAILVESVFVPTFYDALNTFEFNVCDKENYKIINSTNKVCQLLKECKVQFIIIRSQIFDFNPFHIRTSLNREDISSIS